MQTALRTIALFGTIISTCLIPSQGMALDLKNELAHRMDHISNAASLSELTIPATHNSSARCDAISGTAKCQNLTIREQLDLGVRYLDIRLRRFSSSFWTSGGIDLSAWPNNSAFTRYDTRGTAINVQDYYKVNACTNKNKWSEIRNRLSEAQWDTNGTLFLNFTSGVRSILGFPNIPSVSNDINKRLIDDFRAVKESRVHHGVMISDFTSRELTMEELRTYFF